jgi:hypothetical protein
VEWRMVMAATWAAVGMAVVAAGVEPRN